MRVSFLPWLALFLALGPAAAATGSSALSPVAAEALTGFPDELRAIATIDLELPQAADDDASARAGLAEADWNGRFDDRLIVLGS